MKAEQSNEYLHKMTDAMMRKNVDELLQKSVDCILCQDDAVCNVVLQELRNREIAIPDQMRVASCHNSKVLDNYFISVTSLKFDNTEIGRTACSILVDMLEGKEVPRKTQLNYEVVLKESTK